MDIIKAFNHNNVGIDIIIKGTHDKPLFRANDIGEIIELSQMTSEPLDILVNGVVIGSGEAIIVDGKFGVKIKHIGKIK